MKKMFGRTRLKVFVASKPLSSVFFCHPRSAPTGLDYRAIAFFILLATGGGARAAERVLDGRMHHLRSADAREWSEFPAASEGSSVKVTFAAEANATPYTLRVRQRDVKQSWRMRLNDHDLGLLSTDENPLTTFWEVPPGVLRTGDNVFVVTGSGPSDDVEIGDLRLIDQPPSKALNEAALSVVVIDADTGKPTPARVTIVNEQGSLSAVGAKSNARLAVRPGVVYTADGRAEFGLAAGKYTIHAGRGFEFSVDTKTIDALPGARRRLELTIRREVPLADYVSCDTHVHTLTYSGHGDCTIGERLVTVAGEGLELPIATDHNLTIDYRPAMREAGLAGLFTPVVGNEVTTQVGHFNVFPLDTAGPAIDHRGESWAEVFAAIDRAGPRRVIVLNHPRDVHAGFRPFDIRRHLALTGENIAGWTLQANAMELVNSGALQTDPWRLVYDWFGLLNAGLKIAPVGASDSHDVARSIVGQARTYIRRGAGKSPSDNSSDALVSAAVESLLAGRVVMSYGLFAELTVENEHGPGDVVAAGDKRELDVRVRVLGPSWSAADEVVLFVNGAEVRRESIDPANRNAAGVKFAAHWKLPRPKHDVYLALVAIGPGISGLYWPTAKPYQPDSPDWKSYVLGATGAVWIDCDGRPGFASPRQYAEALISDAAGDMSLLGERIADYDAATAGQVAAELRRRGELFADGTIQKLTAAALPLAAAAVRDYVAAWKAAEVANGGNVSGAK